MVSPVSNYSVASHEYPQFAPAVSGNSRHEDGPRPINLPAKQVVPPALFERLIKGEKIQLTKDISGEFDQTYNVIRFSHGPAHGSKVTNAWLLSGNPAGIKSIDTNGGAATADEIERLVSAGGLAPSVLERMGFSQEDVKDAKQRSVEDGKLLARLEKDDLSSLPSSAKYTGANTDTVLQGEARIMNVSQKKFDGLYTFGALPCLILVAVSKDQQGKPQEIGMAHIDKAVKSNGLNAFFNSMKKPDGGSLEVSIISGERDTALQTIRAATQNGAVIKFANVDPDGSRNDAAIVGSDGRVYYGGRADLNNNLDSRKLDIVAIQRQMAMGPNVPASEQLRIR